MNVCGLDFEIEFDSNVIKRFFNSVKYDLHLGSLS